MVKIMYIVSFIISLAAMLFCWIPVWSMFFTTIAFIWATSMFYQYYLGAKKDSYKSGKGMVFAGFVIATAGFIGSMIMTGVPTAMYLTLNSIQA